MKKRVRQIIFTKVNTAELIDKGEIDFDKVLPNYVIVKTEISTISSGTEKANITGDAAISVKGVTSVNFPRSSGYSSAGTVVKVGDGVTSVKEGDRVAMIWSAHKNYNYLPESNVVKLPDNIDFYTGALSFISTFPLEALRKTRVEVGESVMIFGLGILGQLAVRFARCCGATPIIGVDINEERRNEALENGADYVFDSRQPDFAEKVKEVTCGGVNVAVEVSGVGQCLDLTLDCMAKFGRVALLGCTRDKNFTIDYYRKVHGPGITLIGAHTAARPEYESSPGFYTHRDDLMTTLKLVSTGRLKINDLISEIHSPEECFEVYTRLVEGKDYPVCVQFDWNKLSE